MMRLRAVVCAARGCSGGQHACHTASSVKHGVLRWLPPIMCGARGARRGAVREARCRARGESVTAPRSRRCMHLMHPMRHVRQTMTSAQGKAAAQPGTCCNGRQHHRVLTVPHCQQPAKSRCRSCSKSSPPRGAPQTHRPSSASPCATLPTRQKSDTPISHWGLSTCHKILIHPRARARGGQDRPAGDEDKVLAGLIEGQGELDSHHRR